MNSTMTDNGLLCNLPVIDENEIHCKNRKNAIVMYSGGMDSTVSLFWALDHYKTVKVLMVDYNQQHLMEIKAALDFAKMVNLDYKIINVSFPPNFWGIKNRLTRGQACLMTSIAAIDIGHEGADIIHGILRTDDYGDCDRSFLDSLANVLFHPEDSGKIGIATPLRAVSGKTSVIALAYMYGIPIHKTWTCRNPYKGKPCGKCAQCLQRKNALTEFFKEYRVNEKIFFEWQSTLGSPYHPIIDDRGRFSYFAQKFIDSGAMKFVKPCLRYFSPDGKERIASKICRISRKNKLKLNRIVKAVTAHGFFEDNYRWELCICEDGSVAATERIPDFEILENSIIKSITSVE